MACDCKLVINELLAFLQNKSEVSDEVSLVQVCCSWYSEEEIENAKTILCEAANIRKISRKGEKKNANNISDIIKIIKESDSLPNYVAKDLRRLPPITFDHIDVSSLLQNISVLKNDMNTFKYETNVTINRLEDEISILKKQKTSVTTNGMQSAVELPANTILERQRSYQSPRIQNNRNIFTLAPENTPKPPLSFKQALLAPVSISEPCNLDVRYEETKNDDEGEFITVSRKRRRLQNDDPDTRPKRPLRPIAKNRRGTNSESALKAAEQIIPVYVSRFSNDCTEEDIITYLKNKGCNTFGIETLKQNKVVNFKSFKVQISKKDLQNILQEDFWPESIVFRIFKERVRQTEQSNKT